MDGVNVLQGHAGRTELAKYEDPMEVVFDVATSNLKVELFFQPPAKHDDL